MWTNENRGRYDRSRLRYPSDLTDDEWNLEGSVRSRGEIATTLTVRDLIEAGLNKPAGSQALWG